MQDAMHLFNLAKGPLHTLARHWICHGLRRAAAGERAGLDWYCGTCEPATTIGGRANATGTS